MSFWAPLLGFVVLLLLPSAQLHVFDGLPVSGLAEFAAFCLMLPLCVSTALRRLYARPLQSRRGAKGVIAIGAALLLAIGAKLLLLAAAGQPGFAACYRSALTPNHTPPSCARSYENLFFRGGVTRIDEAISFDPATWNLSFFNSLGFNFLPWVKGNVERNRLPFVAHWRGEVDQAAPAAIALTYVGEGTLHVGGLPAVPLPPAYRRAETITLTVPDGRRAFALDYRFDDGSRVQDGPAILRGPYASVHVRVGTTPLRPVPPPAVWRVVGAFVDLTMIVILCSIVWCYGRLLGRDAGLAAIACVGGALLAIDPTVTMRSAPFLPLLDYVHPEAARGLPGGIGLTLVTGTLLVLIVRRPSTRLLLLAYLAILWASVFRQDFFLRGFETVFYRPASDDWLSYESFARSILETGSLEAGEPTFYYQPLFRYLVFLAHAVFGDGDTLIALFAQALLIWSVFWMSASLLPRGVVRGGSRVMGIAIGLLLVVLVTSESVSRLIYVGASEYPTWIMFLLLFPRLCVSRARRDWWLGTMMLGLSLITRMNQAIALGWLFAIFLWRAAFARPRFAVQPILLLITIGVLPTVHNAYYGRALSVLPSEHAVTHTLPMPPSRWLRVANDDEAKAQAWTQLGAVTYTGSTGLGTPFVPTVASHAVLLVACRGLQVAWGLAAIRLFRARASTTTKLLLILPALYLSVHLFYQVSDYHPRFIVIGYLAMGAVAMLAVRARVDHRSVGAIRRSSSL